VFNRSKCKAHKNKKQSNITPTKHIYSKSAEQAELIHGGMTKEGTEEKWGCKGRMGVSGVASY